MTCIHGNESCPHARCNDPAAGGYSADVHDRSVKRASERAEAVASQRMHIAAELQRLINGSAKL